MIYKIKKQTLLVRCSTTISTLQEFYRAVIAFIYEILP
ncbi:hypothetical protein yaldo0001_580 [Yersinia aldovae ATCC 35236]|nr:hypothetical protein yaldo0001_580 [Yersinia aldovae ATCC 35236]